MAKYIDENGAEQLNQLLAAKFDTKVDKILATKTYTGILGTANDTTWTQNSFYFMSVRPTSFYDMWSVRYRIYVWVASDNNFSAVADCFFRGNQSNCQAYSSFNNIYSTSYRPAYYHVMYRLLVAGYTAGYGHAIGVSLKDANSKDTSGKERTIKVELLEQVNCTATLLDTAVKWSNWTGTGATNYSGGSGNPSNYNFSSNGLQETGDSDTMYILKSYYERPLVGPGKIYGYNICTYDNDYKIQGFVNSYSTGTAKTKNTATFRIGSPIYYYNSATEMAAGSYTSDNTLITQTSSVDMRYTLNCAKTLVANKPVYLVGIPNGSTFTLADTWYSQTLPSTDDGKIYIHLGYAYNTYQIAWQIYHPVYWYKNGAVRLYTDDTAVESKVAASGGTDLSLVTTGEKYTWNNKGTYSKPSGGIPAADLASAVQTSLVQALPSGTNINVWDLDTGVYKVDDGSSWFYYDNDDNTQKTQLNSEGFLIVKNESGMVRYTLYKGKIIIKGTIDIEYPEDTTYEITTCQSVQNKVTALSSGSTDTQYPSAKCVYDNLALKQNQVTASTTDLTPGTSPLATGELYIVYE